MNIVDEAMGLVIPWDDLHSISLCEGDDASADAKWYNDNTRAAIEHAVRRCAEIAGTDGRLSAASRAILHEAGLEPKP